MNSTYSNEIMIVRNTLDLICHFKDNFFIDQDLKYEYKSCIMYLSVYFNCFDTWYKLGGVQEIYKDTIVLARMKSVVRILNKIKEADEVNKTYNSLLKSSIDKIESQMVVFELKQ